MTEAGYARGLDGRLDTARIDVRADAAALRTGGTSDTVTTVPGRLVAGLIARRAADAGPVAIVSCDNLPANGAVTAGVVRELATLVDPTLIPWIASNVRFVTTMVDRITPAAAADDPATALALTGLADRAPVITEPFSEWVVCGEFPGGRPAWEVAGARFVDDVAPFEERKLWLLNGGHSLLAYVGSVRGHATIADAMADPVCRDLLHEWWDAAAPYLTLPPAEITHYREALMQRFENSRIRHLLGQIAADGSQKLPIRILPVLHRERAAGRLPIAAVQALAGWIMHLRGVGVPVRDAAAAEIVALATGSLAAAAVGVLGYLDPALAGDRELIDAITAATQALESAAATVSPGFAPAVRA